MSDEGTVDLKEFVAGFVAEADDHLRTCRACFVELDAAAREQRDAPGAVRQVYRALHTIKGLAAMVGFERVVALTHEMESVVRTADQQGGRLSGAALDPLVDGFDVLERQLQAVAHDTTVPEAPRALLDRLGGSERADAARAQEPSTHTLALEAALRDKLTESEVNELLAAPQHGQRAVQLEFVPTPERASAGVSITSVREGLSGIAELVRVLPLSRPRSDDAPGGLAFVLLLTTNRPDEVLVEAAGLADGAVVTTLLRASEPAVPGSTARPAETVDAVELALAEDVIELSPAGSGQWSQAGDVVRVPVDRLDEAMTGVSALIVSHFEMARAIEALDAVDAVRSTPELVALTEVFERHSRRLRDIRESILTLRLVQVRDLLARIPLIVRGLRTRTGKSVRAEVDATALEVDKAVAERLFPALVHLVRNAVDHGIETPQARLATSKPEEGVVRVGVAQLTSDQIEITVEDDGRGVDPVAVAERLDTAVPNTDRELLELLARPGVSTRQEVTTTSGRGMGLDIVQRIVVEELRGELTLHNRIGLGTRFILQVPMTLSIIESLTFECAGQVWLVPMASVDEIVDLSTLRVVRGPTPDEADETPTAPLGMIERRGTIVPFVPLSWLVSGELPAPGAGQRLLVVERDGGRFGFGVDRMLGQQQIVLRPLDDPLVRVRGVSGSADLGDGRPTLVLDLMALGERLQEIAAHA